MQRQPEKELRPQAHDLEASKSTTATGSLTIVPTSAPELAYVVIVSTSDTSNRRRPYLSLHSAERAVARAEDRGHTATLHLCRLVPVLPVDGEA